jgi:hypothetical protein
MSILSVFCNGVHVCSPVLSDEIRIIHLAESIQSWF